MNILTVEEKMAIWTPIIVLSNTKSMETVRRDEQTLTKIIVNDNFTHETPDFWKVLRNYYIFKGSENKIKIEQTKETYFLWRPWTATLAVLRIVFSENDTNAFKY